MDSFLKKGTAEQGVRKRHLLSRTNFTQPLLPCQLIAFSPSRKRSTSLISHNNFRPIRFVLIGKVPQYSLFLIVCGLSPIRVESSLMSSIRFIGATLAVSGFNTQSVGAWSSYSYPNMRTHRVLMLSMLILLERMGHFLCYPNLFQHAFASLRRHFAALVLAVHDGSFGFRMFDIVVQSPDRYLVVLGIYLDTDVLPI